MYLRKPDINAGVMECQKTPDAILVDVRESREYDKGHIPGAVNEPMSGLKETLLPKEAPLFLYCLRGRRSKRAAEVLKEMGHTNVKNIGGVVDYRGELVRYKQM